MNLVFPPVYPDTAQPPEDALDGVLRAYFRAQMPRPWPALVLPQSSPTPLRPPSREGRPGGGRWPLFRSRLALAASVALLILGPLFLSGKFQTTGSPSTFRLGPPEGSKPDLKGKPRTNSRLWLDQEPDGGTAIKVEVLELEQPPSK
jgi:hypothetical protein